MALVAYDDSDIEESDEDDSEKPDQHVIQEKDNHQVAQMKISEDASLFSLLPLPKKKEENYILEEDDTFLHKKETEPADHKIKPSQNTVKIYIPALTKIPDLKPLSSIGQVGQSQNKTKLLSMLPEPKFSKSVQIKPNGELTKFVPRTVNVSKPTVVNPVLSKKSTAQRLANLEPYASDESDTEDLTNTDKSTSDFFSLKSEQVGLANNRTDEGNKMKVVNPKVDINSTSSDSEPHGHSTLEMQLQGENVEVNEILEYTKSDNGGTSMDTNGSQGSMQLDEEAIMKLCGRKGRHRREDLKIIDINQKEILPDSKEWLIKAITEDNTKRVSSKRRGDEPTNVQKRKHQITYLAHQAKANEQDLQNQWSQNRMSRRQTQSKYGF